MSRPTGRTHTLRAICAHERVRPLGRQQDTHHPTLGTTREPGSPVRTDGRVAVSTVAPAPGRHQDEEEGTRT